MFNGIIGMGREYKRLPPHNDFAQLADNIERVADYLLDKSLGSFANEGYLRAPDRWEWKLGNDLKTLLQYARDFVPPDADGLHRLSQRK